MRSDEYMDFDGIGLAELVRSGEITAAGVAEAAIARIESVDKSLNALVQRYYPTAREAARRADPAAPLCGVPFLAKDMNIEIAGTQLTYSCRWLEQVPPAAADSPLAARWRSAGLTILGRTNTPEFAGEFVTEPTWRGATRNPWNVALSPGGSSGGAGAAVASGMVPIAHGTDSGGSIRVPAAVCGLVGLKPSRGWVPVGPNLDELAGGLDCEHVLTRTVRDTAMMLDLTAGPDSLARAPLPRLDGEFRRALDATLPPLKIGVLLTAPGGAAPNAEIGAAVEEMADFLARAGHSLRRTSFPDSAEIGQAAGLIWLTAIAEEIEFYTQRLGRAPAPDELEALSRAGLALGKRSSAVDYVRARRALSRATREMAAAFADFDFLMLPTTADFPPRIGEIDGRTPAFDLDRWNAQSYGFAPYTEIFNVTGQPAISLPLAESRDGLPIGLQFAAPLGQDARLISLSAWLERERPWHARLAALRRRYPS
ncbi:MAG TPA: amidase [Steroidobacteraceae bacterium]|jgi:amidase|nr:amidase [Steroidobacteraceae bacterium]